MTNEIMIQDQRKLKIVVADLNKDNFLKFKRAFFSVLLEARVPESLIEYNNIKPFSAIVDYSYKDKFLNLATDEFKDIVEISEFSLSDETGEVDLETIKVLYPGDIDYSQDEHDDFEESTPGDDLENLNHIDLDQDELNNSEDEDQIDENTSDDDIINSYIAPSVAVDSVTLGDNHIDELFPTVKDILDDLNPTLTDLPVSTNPIVSLTANQQQSNLYMLYGMLGKSLARLDKTELAKELEKFKTSGMPYQVPEVVTYFQNKDSVTNKVNELNEVVETISSRYEINFREWLENRIEELKQQYAIDHPDTTEQDVAQFLAENKPALDALEHAMLTSKDKASQALIRVFSATHNNESLGDAMRFVMIKSRAREAIEAVHNAYEGSSAVQELFERTGHVEHVTQSQEREHEHESTDYDTSLAEYINDGSDASYVVETPDDIDLGDATEDEDDEFAGLEGLSYENNQSSEPFRDELQPIKDLGEVDLTALSDEDLISLYNKYEKGEPIYIVNGKVVDGPEVDNGPEAVSLDEDTDYTVEDTSYGDAESYDAVDEVGNYDQPDYLHDEPVEVQTEQIDQFDDLSGGFDEAFETEFNDDYPVQEDNTDEISEEEMLRQAEELGRAMEMNENQDDEQSIDLSDSIDMGQTTNIPVLPDEFAFDLEGEGEAEDLELTQRVDAPDGLDGNGLASEGFQFIEDEEVNMDEVVDEPKKGKKDKKAKKEKPKKEKTPKPKGKGLSTGQKVGAAVGGVAVVAALGVGAALYLGGNSGSSDNNTPVVNEQTKAEKDAFFEEAAKYNIALDEKLTVPINDQNIDVTITSLNDDMSMTVTSDEGKDYTIPYSVVKQFVEDRKALSGVSGTSSTDVTTESSAETTEATTDSSTENSTSESSEEGQ